MGVIGGEHGGQGGEDGKDVGVIGGEHEGQGGKTGRTWA